MCIIAVTLSFALIVSLHSIELMSSEPRTLEELFPGYKGVMPLIEEFQYEHQFRNFETFFKKTMIKYVSISLVKRDHIIFGWMWGVQESIGNPSYLFPPLENVFIAFDIRGERWITLSRDLSRKLGANRRLDFVVARDEVAATHVTTSNNPRYKEAHIKACREANDRADIVEQEKVDLLGEGITTAENSTREIKEEYSRAYNRAFMLHLHPHGEYNIHGHRGRHP